MRSARERALEVFAELGVWDTRERNGVLIYVLLAERDVEIVADRGFDGRVSNDEWQRVCTLIERRVRRGPLARRHARRHRGGDCAPGARIPCDAGRNVNEQQNRPAVL